MKTYDDFTPLKPIEEWLTMHKNTQPSYIKDILPAEPGEYGFIAGRTGIGKSILCLHIAYCLANGLPFLGFDCTQVDVGYLAMEGGEDNIKDRIRKVSQQYPSSQRLRFELRPPFPLERHADGFKKVFQGCHVVILDNLRQVTSGKYLDPNYAASWIKVYQNALLDIGAVGILTHHVNKRSFIAPDEIYGDSQALKGATEYVDASTTVLLLERKRQSKGDDGKFKPADPNLVTLYFAKHRISTTELMPIALRRNYQKAAFDIVGENE